jgi:hypothetical protein
VDDKGNQYVMFDDTLEHQHTEVYISEEDGFISLKNDMKQRRKDVKCAYKGKTIPLI